MDVSSPSSGCIYERLKYLDPFAVSQTHYRVGADGGGAPKLDVAPNPCVMRGNLLLPSRLAVREARLL